MKNIVYILIGFFINLNNLFAASIKDDIIPDEGIIINTGETGTNLLYSILEYIRDSIFGLLALIAIGVFIFIGARLIIARGNPEEFKKAIMQFVYAIVGLAIVALSWGIVKIVSSLNL